MRIIQEIFSLIKKFFNKKLKIGIYKMKEKE